MNLAMLTSCVGLRASFSTCSSSRRQALGKFPRLWSKDLLVTKTQDTPEIVNTCISDMHVVEGGQQHLDGAAALQSSSSLWSPSVLLPDIQPGPPGCVPPVMEIINIRDASANREELWSACVHLSFT